MTHFQTLPSFHADKHFEQVLSRLGKKYGLQDVHKVFLWFNLVSYFLTPHSQVSNFVQAFMKLNILTKFGEDWAKHMASRMFKVLKGFHLVI